MNAGRAFVGGVLVVVGSLFVAETAGSLDATDVIARWWPGAVIALGLFVALDRGRFGAGPAWLVVGGAVLLTLTSGAVDDDGWRYVWPTALILAGVLIIFGWGRRAMRAVPDLETVDGAAIVSAVRVATRSQHFRRASLTAVLGGVTLDLAEASAPEGAVVDATAILGSVTILVPRGWLVEVRGIPILGGWDDTTDRTAAGSGASRLEVRALVALGGLEVKHAGRWST
jgi:hypothetical protein